ncbi:glycosyltransferase family 9 protein [Candidatus Pseudothioglobus singularis]|uniref:Heptosyltransferase n=1 Tax=Candidatus Pseudothioglobus singularis PS1 TaxID=1125411 RepID=A0A0M3T2I1_9GAMM|nr:glycosyltransferase family 9 protein [Candidatus Pseudothioglobus singularis]ALE02775.1 hypothetical protein W908_07165 [Candidatus Pseudothioglobus singularis PS1]
MFKFDRTYKLPFKYKVENDAIVYLQQNSIFKRYLKFIKRCFIVHLLRQYSLELDNISKKHKNILWINISAPSFGDSLMDLSSRVLLQNKNVDLFTNITDSSIYSEDEIFSNVFTDKKLIIKKKYNLVIIDSYSTRSLKVKFDIAPSTPFVGMYGFYNGPDINRTLFSFHRLNHLLGYVSNEKRINEIAKPSLTISENDKEIVKIQNLPTKYIVVALGGEWPFRTFTKWDTLLKKILHADNNLNIVIVGSSNGGHSAKIIMDQFENFNVYDCVSQFSFTQTAYIIKKGEVLFCCDGGLMHAACAVDTCFIPLFARVNQQMRLTNSINAYPLFDNKDVNNINTEVIYKKYIEVKEFLDQP